MSIHLTSRLVDHANYLLLFGVLKEVKKVFGFRTFLSSDVEYMKSSLRYTAYKRVRIVY